MIIELYWYGLNVNQGVHVKAPAPGRQLVVFASLCVSKYDNERLLNAGSGYHRSVGTEAFHNS